MQLSFFHRYFSLLFCVKKSCFTTRNLTCRFFTYDKKNTAILLTAKKKRKNKMDFHGDLLFCNSKRATELRLAI